MKKLSLLGLNTPLCNWILDFLTERLQSVCIGSRTSSTIKLSTGAPQKCVLSPLLFMLLTHDCLAKSESNLTVMFADYTTVLGLISNNNETPYREAVEQLVSWCHYNKSWWNNCSADHPPLLISGSAVESQKYQVSWHPHLVHPHQLCFEEGTAMTSLPAEDEESQPYTTYPHHLLQRNCGKHPGQLHLCVVWKLQKTRT